MSEETTTLNVGSSWGKWDLHVHTPLSLHNNYSGDDAAAVWEKFLVDLEGLPPDFKVLGVNDYLFLNGYKKLKEEKEKNGRLSNIELLLPVLEFRIKKFAGVEFGNFKRINLHVIFSDKIDSSVIESQFLSSLQSKYTRNDGTEFSRAVNPETLTELGAEIKKDVPPEELVKYKSDIEEGFNNLNVDEEELISLLKNRDCFKDNYLIAIGKTEWDSLNWTDGSIAEKKSIINKADIVFTAAESVDIFTKAKEKLSNQNVKDLLLDCSDAHAFSDSGNKDRIGNCNTWIKADKTFEGLKQVVYEPQSGVRHIIKEDFPKRPINTIDSLILNIPSDAKVGEDNFCFAGNKNTYFLSPYFNCFIGGRGSGKSTILNFLGLSSNNPESPEMFWSDLYPNFNPKDKNIFSFTGTEIFEFLAQSKIEEFARNRVKFTGAIYDRINGPSKILQSFEEEIEECNNHFDKIVDSIFEKQELLEQKGGKEKEKRSLEETKSIIDSGEYKEITEQISEITKKIQIHEKWANETSLFKTHIEDTVNFYSEILKDNTDEIKYKEAYILAISKIKEATDLLNYDNFSLSRAEQESLKTSLLLLEESLKNLLDKGNFSEDNIQQIKSAPYKIAELERDIEQITFQTALKDKVINSLNSLSDKVQEDKKIFEEKIRAVIEPLQSLLEKQFEDNEGRDIKKISLEYYFDEKRAWNNLSKEFFEKFKECFDGDVKEKYVCDCITDNKEVFLSDNLSEIQTFIKQSTKDEKQYIKFLEEIFSNENYFVAFRAIRNKHLHDVKTNKIIQVKYDGKGVEQVSFGQRCTAVVVILILFGNNPLIIDEPEAHLDSSLIANYLVPLLKKNKTDRQVIFATHNANFVINGDAEKIFILKNETGNTEIIETTIENIDNRNELLKLEGGKEAFQKRGEKMSI